VLEFYSDSDVSNVFDYVTRTESLMNYLKVVYQSWMLCAHFCTQQDIFVMSAQLENTASTTKKRHAANAQDCMVMKREDVSDDEDDSDDKLAENTKRSLKVVDLLEDEAMSDAATFIQKTTVQIAKLDKLENIKASNSAIKTGTANWADTAKSKESTIKNAANTTVSASEDAQTQQQQPASSLIDISKLNEMLPPAFIALPKDLQQFAVLLMTDGTLLPYQLTSGLCQTLSIAETEAAKKRAKSVLYKLSKVPAVQLTNLSNVSRFIVHGHESLQTPAPAPAVASTPLTSTPSPHEMIDAFEASNVAAVDEPTKDQQTSRCIVS